MQWSEVTFNASPRVLRQFAAIWLVVFGGLAVRKFCLEETTPGLIFVAIAAGLGLPGLIRPRSIRHVYGTAMLAAFPLGWFVSQLLLVLIFFGIFWPVALLFRLMGRDVLRRKISPDAKSYWETRSQATKSTRYFEQF